MGHSGWFNGGEGEEWAGTPWQELGQVCRVAALTNREAQVLNLYCRGFSVRKIGELLAIERATVIVWRHLRHGATKISRISGNPSCPGRRREILAVLHCIRNSAGRERDHGPPIYFDSYGRARELTPAQVVTVEDLLESEELTHGLDSLQAILANFRTRG